MEWSYDALGRVVREALNGEAVESRYDEVGNRIERTSPFGCALSLAYDEGDRLREIADPVGRLLAFEYDRIGRETRRVLPSGVVSERRYAKTGELLEQHTRRGTTAAATATTRRASCAKWTTRAWAQPNTSTTWTAASGRRSTPSRAWSAYRKYKPERWQLCWAHLARNLMALSESRDEAPSGAMEQRLREWLEAEEDWFIEPVSPRSAGTMPPCGACSRSMPRICRAAAVPADGVLPLLIASARAKKPGELLQIPPAREWSRG